MIDLEAAFERVKIVNECECRSYMRDTMYLLYNTVDTVRIRLHFRYNQIQYMLY